MREFLLCALMGATIAALAAACLLREARLPEGKSVHEARTACAALPR